jgi:hypothetical protein
VVQRQTKTPVRREARADIAKAAPNVSDRESGRYSLQVDKQTKSAFQTTEAAHSAAFTIKKSFPVPDVSIYDSVDNSHTVVKLPSAT